jgi:hypothetical protein
VVLLTVVASMAFALRGLSSQKRADVGIGIAIAVAVMTFGGWMGWRAIRYLEADDERNRREEESR